ncbi:nitroreductase family protein [Shouchella patagoniensis]|uniref:nitroreductase family protein n=1 Tax=Shouchella patagoniensis TaxID=228576 RepID=UPI000995DBD6|nr:nitroreductase family protein [Shouchella patagoniensis]
MTTFYQAIENRRSYYAVSKEEVVSSERIQEIVEHAVKYVPSAFNSQSARVLVLFANEHDAFWDNTTALLKDIVGDGDFSGTQAKMDGFKAGSGTVLFFEDQTVVEDLQESFALYADNFPVWSEQSSGMLQFAIWTALELEGLGASLQHYNPIVDEMVASKWDIPKSWKLRAQMPFGKPAQDVGEKEFKPLEDRVKIAK